MELIIGAHRDAPAPFLGHVVLCQVANVIRAGKPVRIVDVSGQPKLATLVLAPVTGGSLAQQGAPRVHEDVRHVQRAVAALRPAYPGIDDLAAISVAADEARSDGDPHAELVLADSGLDDRGVLNFTVRGLMAATPAEVTAQLRSSHNLPELRGFTVILEGIGYTAPPQEPLTARWRTNVTAIWTAVLRTAGARVVVIPQPGLGPSIRTSEPVRQVPVPPGQPVTVHKHAMIVFTGESPVRFEPDSTAFVDPKAAAGALTPIARWLSADHSRHAWLEGTTADVGRIRGQILLATLRADKVRRALMKLGAGRSQISVTGVGSEFPQFVPDRSASGILLAGPATLNRSVRITLS